MPCKKNSRAGGAPPRTDALIGPAACGRCLKLVCLKRRASGALALFSLALLFWRSDSLEHGLNISETPRSCALQRAPVRWTLTLETNHLWSLGPCQSRKIMEQRIQRLQSRELSRWRHAAEVYPKEHEPTTWHRNKELNSRGKTKPKRPACFNSESK